MDEESARTQYLLSIPTEPIPPFYSLPPFSLTTFFQLYQQNPHDVETAEEVTILSQEERPSKCQRTNSASIPCLPQDDSSNLLILSSGRVLRFQEEDGLYLLLPYWFESNIYVRKIVSRCFRSVACRMRYFDKIMDEEEGYDEDGEMSYYHLRDQVMESFIVETRLRRAMRNVLTRWRVYKMNKRHCTDVDPITLSEPEKRVVLYDWNVKRKFIFDAKSLSIHMETALLYQEGGFAMPRYPRNPWNNLDFMYYQLISIYEQLKAYGELRWALTTLRTYNFNITTWHQYHHSAIIMKAVQTSLIQLDSPSARELLEDFIIMTLTDVMPVTDFVIRAYRAGIVHLPHHWYIDRWKRLAYIYHEGQHFGQNRMEKIREVRNELLKRQQRFFNDVVQTGHLQV